MKTILVFGNPLVTEDALALKIADKLSTRPEVNEKFRFIKTDSLDNLEEYGENLLILDVAANIKKVEIITDLKMLEQNKIYSMHDFDLGFNLKLLKKLGKIKSVKIIAIPMNYSEKQALTEIKEKLNSI
ncbi:MAG: hypothetical protein V1672_02870 [Candidatus Diapherotrites archaeon]